MVYCRLAVISPSSSSCIRGGGTPSRVLVGVRPLVPSLVPCHGWCWSLAVSSPLFRSTCEPTPPSNCSWGWGGWCVVRRGGRTCWVGSRRLGIRVPPHEHRLVGVERVVVLAASWSSFPSSSAPSTHDPPCEQLLAELEVGAVSLVLVSLHHRSTRDPPPEQLLVGLGTGGVSFVAVGGRGGSLALGFVVGICWGVWVGQ